MGHGHKSEEDKDVAFMQDAVTTDDDYQTELPKGSTSLAAAKAGDMAVAEAQGTPSPFRLPTMHFSSEHSEEKEQEFRAKAKAYDTRRLGHGKSAAAYKDMMAQADGYRQDGRNLEEANTAYNQLVPQSSFALDSVIRFKAIQAELGIDFADGSSFTVGEQDLTNHVGDRKSELAQSLSDSGIKMTKGHVKGAALRFEAAQANMFATLTKLQGFHMRQVINALEAEKAESVEKRNKIKEAIESAHSVTEFAGKAISIGGDGYVGYNEVKGHDHAEESHADPSTKAPRPKKDETVINGEHVNVRPPPGYKDPKTEHAQHDHQSHTNTKVMPAHEETLGRVQGAFEVAQAADELGGVAIGIVMHAIHDSELAQIEATINSLDTEIQDITKGEAANAVDEMKKTFQAAKTNYIAARYEYENALASRRTAYAKAGAKADAMHGGSLKGGKDKASQTMLFVSAARETKVILETALPSADQAEDVLRKGLRGMQHRARAYLEDDWRWGEPEGSETADRQQLMEAFGLTTKWLDATKKEVNAFEPIEKAASAMLDKTGKATGDY